VPPLGRAEAHELLARHPAWGDAAADGDGDSDGTGTAASVGSDEDAEGGGGDGRAPPGARARARALIDAALDRQKKRRRASTSIYAFYAQSEVPETRDDDDGTVPIRTLLDALDAAAAHARHAAAEKERGVSAGEQGDEGAKSTVDDAWFQSLELALQAASLETRAKSTTMTSAEELRKLQLAIL